MEKDKKTTQVLITADDQTPWFAVRLFHRSLRRATTILYENGITHFVPMRYVERTYGDQKTERRLVPVVMNLIFVKKTLKAIELQKLLADNFIPSHVLTLERGSHEACEIPAQEMRELIYICNPDKVLYEMLTTEEAQLQPGTEVYVTRGPMAGQTGRLVRKHHQYFLLRLYTGFSVMVKVSRWCCRAL